MSTEPEAGTPLTPEELEAVARHDSTPELTPEPEQSVPPTVTVSLAKLVDAATDGRRYLAGVKAVQAALASHRFLPAGVSATGVFDSGTLAGYRALQLHLGFTPGRANGVPDRHSLTWLSLKAQTFTVTD